MRHVLITTALVAPLAAGAHAQSLSESLDRGIEFLNNTGAGLSVGQREVADDGTVVLRDVRLAPDGDEEVYITAPEITFRPTGDTEGGVEVSLRVVTITDPDPEAPVDVVVTGENFTIVGDWMAAMSGTPDVTVTADSLTVAGGNPDHPVLKSIDVGATDLEIAFAGSMAERGAEARFAVADLAADYRIVDPTIGSTQDVSFTYDDYRIEFSGENLPMSEADLERFVDEDGAFSLTGAAGAGTFDISIDQPELPLALDGSAGGGTVEISLADGRFTYATTADGFTYNIATDPATMPMPPFSVTAGTIDIDINGPVRPTEGAAPLVFALAINELGVSEEIWAMFDPEGLIPRAPATLDIDLSADVDIDMPLVEAFDEDGEGDMADPFALGRVTELDVTRIFLEAGGAMIEAMGRLEVGYEGPFPNPEGQIDVTIRGVQGLAEALGETGLVPPEQIAPVMGMMMMFAQPAEEPDTFTSEIVFRDGGITANGVELQ